MFGAGSAHVLHRFGFSKFWPSGQNLDSSELFGAGSAHVLHRLGFSKPLNKNSDSSVLLGAGSAHVLHRFQIQGVAGGRCTGFLDSDVICFDLICMYGRTCL